MAKVKKDQKDLEEKSLILVSDETYDAFCEALSADKKPNEKLRRLFDK